MWSVWIPENPVAISNRLLRDSIAAAAPPIEGLWAQSERTYSVSVRGGHGPEAAACVVDGDEAQLAGLAGAFVIEPALVGTGSISAKRTGASGSATAARPIMRWRLRVSAVLWKST
jgi:hypothetical protein